jgi:hypothetical protein
LPDYRELNTHLVVAIAAIVFLFGAYLTWFGVDLLSRVYSSDGPYIAYARPLIDSAFGLILVIVSARFLLLLGKAFGSTTESSMISSPASSSVSNISVLQIPAVYESLRTTGGDGSFAALMPSTAPGKRKEPVNLQFSIEDGRIGFDWVLLAPTNIADRTNFEALAESLRFKLTEVTANNVKYLRTTDSRSVELCTKVLSDLYSVPETARIDLIAEGFEWPR